MSGLPSVNAGSTPGSVGPAEAVAVSGRMQIVMQNAGNDQVTGAPIQRSPLDGLLDSLTSVPWGAGGPTTKEADLGAYEARFNPDHGAGSSPGQNPPIDSDPYAATPWAGGLAIADAAGNDVLLFRNGKLSTLAALPLINENVPPNFFSPGSPAVTIPAQAVPTAIAAGPDGNLYIAELGGAPYDVGNTNIYKLDPSGRLTTVATGFTMVGDLAFDRAGRLLVLEIDQAGLLDPNVIGSGLPTPGALLRVNRNGSRTTLASQGLEYPLGLAVAHDGSIYVTNFGTVQGHNDPYNPAYSGELVRVTDDGVPGYREAASDGGVFDFGQLQFYGSLGSIALNRPVVGFAPTPLAPGYWEVASDGGVFSFGTAGFFGSTGVIALNKPVVGMAPTPDGRGYYLFASDGGVFTFGDARFRGSTGNLVLNKPVLGGAVTPDGRGYYLFASDGGVFTFGDARFRGSTGNLVLTKPVVGGAVTPDGRGYYLFASDGGVFTFGDARFRGSTGNLVLNKPVVGGAVTLDGGGYFLGASDGGIFSFGDAGFYGSTGGIVLNKPVVAVG